MSDLVVQTLKPATDRCQGSTENDVGLLLHCLRLIDMALLIAMMFDMASA